MDQERRTEVPHTLLGKLRLRVDKSVLGAVIQIIRMVLLVKDVCRIVSLNENCFVVVVIVKSYDNIGIR